MRSIPTSNPPCTQDENGLFTGVSGEYRVKNVKVDGEDLDLEKTYTLASHNYMLKNAGDGFTMFQNDPILQDEVMIDNQVLINYITGTLGGNVGEAVRQSLRRRPHRGGDRGPRGVSRSLTKQFFSGGAPACGRASDLHVEKVADATFSRKQIRSTRGRPNL